MMKSWWAFCSIGLSVTSRNPYPSWKGYYMSRHLNGWDPNSVSEPMLPCLPKKM
ncbi:hypothetical protein ALQ42_00612 [Pseudomonas savastanoi pv. glycinea]|uniref:Uncharacterized protein n=1 Tax=Pseudomonas savastanoi pv. glycinea TaxID=318 RepID=A0A3M3U3J8_PSESG|nr:hypothetical protein ALQ42_00612 [Pseudomonas savastanoi pv. glycinea]